MTQTLRGVAALVAPPFAVLLVAAGCGAPSTGARESSAGGVLAPGAFSLTLRGIDITLDDRGAVHAGDCAGSLDFRAATFAAPDGSVLSRLGGDNWPRALVIAEGHPPVTVSERDVVAGDRTLFSVAEDGRLLDAGGGAPGPTEIVTRDLDPIERTTALALLALVSACWEAPSTDVAD